jgi:type VI secretion system protein VasD
MLHRRGFLIAMAATDLLSACSSGPPEPATVTVTLNAQPGMNPGPDGSERSVIVLVLRLRSVSTFNSADFFALQANPATALGADLVGLDQVAVLPGATITKTIVFEKEAAFLGLVELLRDPGDRVWRTSAPVAPDSTVTANVTLGQGGMTLALG